MGFKSSRFNVIYCVFLGVFLLGCSGSEKTEKPSKNSEVEEPQLVKDMRALSKQQAANQARVLPDDAPVKKMTVTEFVQLKKDIDLEELIGKFDGKWIEISGFAALISFSEVGINRTSPVVTLSDRADLNLDLFQKCYTPDMKPWDHFQQGEQVTLRGMLTKDFLGSEPIIDRCKLISSDGTPVETLTASELAKEFANSPQAADKKYPPQQYVVSGKVKGVIDYESLHLQGHGKYDVLVHWNFKSRQEPKVGDAITVIGNLHVDPSPIIEDDRFLWVQLADNITHFSVDE